MGVLVVSGIHAAEPSRATDNPEARSESDAGRHALRLRTTVLQYENSIAELERFGGAYENQIGEVLIGLGLAYRDLGQYKKAVEVFNRSLHITRVNNGLYDDNQLPVLDLIIETNIMASDWEALDENYHYLYWLNRRVHGDANTRLLDVIDRLTRWHLNAYVTKYDSIPFKHLLLADRLFHDAVEIIESNYGPTDPRLIKALNGIAVCNYHIASYITDSSSLDFEEIRSSTLTMDRAENVSDEFIARSLFLDSSFRTRKKVMNRIKNIITAHPQLPVADRAAALINAGDWDLVYARRGSASKNYAEAYQLLLDAGIGTDVINGMFSPAVRIPTMTIDMYQSDGNIGDIQAGESYVTLSFNVMTNGCASNIRVIDESDPENHRARKYGREFVQSSLFRPQFDEKRTVAARNVSIKLSGTLLQEGSDRKYVSYHHPEQIYTHLCNYDSFRQVRGVH